MDTKIANTNYTSVGAQYIPYDSHNRVNEKKKENKENKWKRVQVENSDCFAWQMETVVINFYWHETA